MKNHVVSYDRLGMGFGESAKGNRDGATIAGQLDELLMRSGEKPPYILVGHSFGGLLAMQYAHLHPQRTAGLVLIIPGVEHLNILTNPENALHVTAVILEMIEQVRAQADQNLVVNA